MSLMASGDTRLARDNNHFGIVEGFGSDAEQSCQTRRSGGRHRSFIFCITLVLLIKGIKSWQRPLVKIKESLVFPGRTLG